MEREERERLKEMNKSLQQREYEKKKQLSIQTNREKLLDERNRIIEVMKFKKEKSKHFEKLHRAIKDEENRATQELQTTIEKKEREFKLKAQRRVQENEERMIRELDEKIKREEEFKARKLRSEIAQLERDMSKKLKELDEREKQTKEMEEHQKKAYKRKMKELQNRVRQEELSMLTRMQERLQSGHDVEQQDRVAQEIADFMKNQKVHYEMELKQFEMNISSSTDNFKLDPLSKLKETIVVLEYETVEWKMVGIDIWMVGGFLHEYCIYTYGKLLPRPSKKEKLPSLKDNPEEYLRMNPNVPPPPGYVPPPPKVTTPIVNTGGVFKLNIQKKEKSSLEVHEQESSSGPISLSAILEQRNKLKKAQESNSPKTTEVAAPIGMHNSLFHSLQSRRKILEGADSDSEDDAPAVVKKGAAASEPTNPMMAMLLQRIDRLKKEQKEALDDEAWENEFGEGKPKQESSSGDDDSDDSDW